MHPLNCWNKFVPVVTTNCLLIALISFIMKLYLLFCVNRPLALRGHVTNASFKQWVGILLMPKIVRAHKNYLTVEIWEEMHLREIFYGTLIFQQSSMICIGRHVGGHAFALQHGSQNYFLLISCSTFHSYARMCCKRYHIIFSTFSLYLKSKPNIGSFKSALKEKSDILDKITFNGLQGINKDIVNYIY